jgi:phospholipase C
MSTAMQDNIEHVVFLMLENRSFDNLLGWLYSKSKPENFYPEQNTTPFDGLFNHDKKRPKSLSNPCKSPIPFEKVGNYDVTKLSSKDMRPVPFYDPYEAMHLDLVELAILKKLGWVNADYRKGVMNQLFGTEEVYEAMPSPGDKPTMKGFLQDYYDSAHMRGRTGGLDILATYTAAHAPNLFKLAHNYAVSDRWFCSVPTQTNPNRAFSICGTSLGRENNLNMAALEKFDAPTIFNRLAEKGKTWRLYFGGEWLSTRQCFTEYTFPRIGSAKTDRSGNVVGDVRTMEQFFEDAKRGLLPAFTYLEPKWGGSNRPGLYSPGDDFHPNQSIKPGDDFLGKVYGHLTGEESAEADKEQCKKTWEKTLLVVTFDEHGGTYDHVAPPWGATPPDGHTGKSGFEFNLFGVRVPTLLVSPCIPSGTVFRSPEGDDRPFDHTSFIATILSWAGYQRGEMNLGKRVKVAPSFEGVFSAQSGDGRAASRLRTPSMPEDSEEDFSGEEGPALQSVGDLFDGVGFASVRAILANSRTIEEVALAIEKYRDCPEEFEKSLGAEFGDT